MRSIFELGYRYVFPAVMRMLVEELERLGVRESEIARMLGIPRSTVSRYLSGERGGRLDLSDVPEVALLVKRLAASVKEGAAGPEKVYLGVTEAALQALAAKVLCRQHALLDPRLDPERCSVCPTLFASRGGSA